MRVQFRLKSRAALITGVVAIVGFFTLSFAHAEDTFGNLFSGSANERYNQSALPYASDPGPSGLVIEDAAEPERKLRKVYIFSTPRRHHHRIKKIEKSAFCVRTCDGRYFPTRSSEDGVAVSCNNFCPASNMMVVYGSTIDSASDKSGKPYSEMPNAFRYRNEVVPGCTCNGKTDFGLAAVSIEDDPTLRKGDIVSTANGLMVVGRHSEHHAEALNFTPAPKSIRTKFETPLVASQ